MMIEPGAAPSGWEGACCCRGRRASVLGCARIHTPRMCHPHAPHRSRRISRTHPQAERQRRLKRAFDLSSKHIDVPEALRVRCCAQGPGGSGARVE